MLALIHATFGAIPSPLRGVNLGGLFVLEPYVRPELFMHACSDANCPIDEHSLAERLGPVQVERTMREHWDNFVTFEELKALRDSGLNAIRIPVGYWIVMPKGEPYASGGLWYLLRVCRWASYLKLRVLIELHSAPGRQNNMDHSGWKDHMGWQKNPCPGQPSLLQSRYVNETVEVLQKLTDVLQEHELISMCKDGTPCGTVFGIGVVNEPISFDKKHPVDHAGLIQLFAVALERLPPSIYAMVDIFEGFEWMLNASWPTHGGEIPLLQRPLVAFDKHRYASRAHTSATLSQVVSTFVGQGEVPERVWAYVKCAHACHLIDHRACLRTAVRD